MTERADFIVIGAGMGGASVAYELAAHGKTILLEREDQPAYHSTGRSAATSIETYGEPIVCALTSASRTLLADPPDGFAEDPILLPRGLLYIGREDQLGLLDEAAAAAHVPVERLDGAAARNKVPILADGYVAGALYDSGAADLDVHVLLQGYLRGLRARGGALVGDAQAERIERRDGVWQVAARAGAFAAPILVNAAGAWADEVAAMAGVQPIGLVPKRRTAFHVDPPEGTKVGDWPMVVDASEEFYFKPDAGRLLVSPADETPSPPTDAQPEDLDIAIAVDRIQKATSLEIRRIEHRWAGLRSFVEDHLPVVGKATDEDSFLWLAAQGGNGIMTAPALAWIVGAAATGSVPHAALAEHDIDPAALSPARLI